jgi:hypothetical protein
MKFFHKVKPSSRPTCQYSETEYFVSNGTELHLRYGCSSKFEMVYLLKEKIYCLCIIHYKRLIQWQLPIWKLQLCRKAGVKSQISYQIQTGKPSEKIVKVIEETNVDLIIMASNNVGSSIREIGSTARKVIDNVKKPVLIVHE